MPPRPRRLAQRLLLLIFALALAAPLTGCNQLSAKRNVSRLQRILEEIQAHEGDVRPYRFRESEVTALENEINQIRDLIAREQYAEAADRARRSMETAPALRDNVIQDHAAQISAQAEEDIGIAEANEAVRENQELWDTILATREEVRQDRGEQRWQRVIDKSQKIIDDVRTLLLNLRNRAIEGHNLAVNRMTAFEALDAERYAPALVVQSRELTNRVQSLIEARQYRLAIATAEEAQVKINETITETERQISDEGISYLESLAAEVIEHGGNFRLVERYQNFDRNFSELLDFFYLQEYKQAIAQIQVLTPVAQMLVLDTYRAEAEELIELRQEEIRQLQEAEVERYLPGRIQEAIDQTQSAEEQYQRALDRIEEITAEMSAETPVPGGAVEDQPADPFAQPPADPFAQPPAEPFATAGPASPATAEPASPTTAEPASPAAGAPRAPTTATGALAERLLSEVKPVFAAAVTLGVDAGKTIDSIHQAFRELAESHLADAQAAINVAVDVLGQFDTIWDPRMDRATDPADVQFEENKQMMRGEIESRLESARILKATADFRLADQRYNVAIQYADQARGDAEEVLADTYRVATRYALIELTWMIDHYEREGAGEYATAELDRTLRLVEETRQVLETGDPREAVARAAAARAQLEIMIQSLRRVANDTINELRREEDATAQMLGNIGAPERLELITRLRTTAEGLARADQLKDAIETAQRGLRAAETTTTEAAREWAQTELDDARARIAHAEQAGAATYAATALQEARDLADTARARFEESDYLGSQLAAAAAATKADEARLALITQAEEANARAEEYEGWRFQAGPLADALVANQRALRAMAEGNFAESRELATFSRERADEITQVSRQALYLERVAGLRQSIEHAIATGSSYFQPDELEAILDDLAKIEANYTPERHDDFDRDLAALENRMAILIEGTPQILAQTLDEYRAWVRALREKGADLYGHRELEAVARAIREADQNFETGHYRQSYRDAREAGRLLTRVQVMADEFDYKVKVDDILRQLEQAREQFSNYIRVSPAVLTYLAVQPDGSSQAAAIASDLTPSEFRREVERLQDMAEEIDPPPTRAEHFEQLLACLRNAQLGARNFELLAVADLMDERGVHQSVENAYQFIEASRRQSTELTAGLVEAPLVGPVTMTELGRPLLLRAEANSAYGQYD